MKKALDLMIHDLTVIEERSSLKEAAQLLDERHLSGVPVINKKEEVTGFISEKDVIAAVFPEDVVTEGHGVGSLLQLGLHLGRSRPGLVQDYMTKNLHVVKQSASSSEIRQLILGRDIKRIPVLDDEKHLLGVIDRSSLLKLSQEKL